MEENISSEILYRNPPAPGARYISGNLVFDEMFVSGRLMTRYWNPNGQVLPDMYYGYDTSQNEKFGWTLSQPADSFALFIDGSDLTGGYEWISSQFSPDTSSYRPRLATSNNPMPVSHGTVTLRHAEAGVEIKVHTRLDGSQFLIRWLEITNQNDHVIGISSIAPFAGMFWSHRYEEHLSPAFNSPFELAFNHSFDWGYEGDFWFEPLLSGCKVVDGGKKGRSGWGRPAFWVKDHCNGQTFVCELAWGGNYTFELDCRLQTSGTENNLSQPSIRQAELYFRMGLSGYDEALRVLDAGETLTTPTVHIGLFHTNVDEIVQVTHDHVRKVVMPVQVPGREIEIEANHRGYLCDRETVPGIIKDIDVAASLGVEMYVVDAGWYGNEPNQWWNNTGDWHDGAWLARDGGLKAIVDYAHQKGLKFGLWVEIEAAGANSNLRREHPGWLLQRNSKPIAQGRALDLTQLEVAAWVESEIERLIETYELDMFRIDHNHLIQPSGNRLYQGITEDLTWRYYEALYGIFDRVRGRHPQIVFQNCAGGGGRLDWGTLSHFHNSELSDWMRLPRGLKILYGITMSLPPEILLRTFGTEVPEHTLDGNVDAQLRMCFSRIIFRGIAPSLEDLTPFLRAHIEHFLDLYKIHIRPLLKESQVFHHTPFQAIAQTFPWCILEYARPDRSEAVAVIIRTSEQLDGDAPDEYILRPRGIDPGRNYHVLLDNKRLEFPASGSDLVGSGLRIRLEPNLSSELVVLVAENNDAPFHVIQ
jgi:alpha-galactosidase